MTGNLPLSASQEYFCSLKLVKCSKLPEAQHESMRKQICRDPDVAQLGRPRVSDVLKQGHLNALFITSYATHAGVFLVRKIPSDATSPPPLAERTLTRYIRTQNGRLLSPLTVTSFKCWFYFTTLYQLPSLYNFERMRREL